ncbi:fasciclin domain-containing protein [Ascidiimonas sp. W6]|uniref:fasciclin domain-containing protein n=1 Tax=Ascidiimonas meishanensis TaxID=3128903 RepID=UPI0030EC839F
MKNLLKIAKIFTIALTFLAAGSCSSDDDGTTSSSDRSITANAILNSDLSILVDALTRANLAATLDSAGAYTVFAPTNQAFSNLLNDLGFSSLEEVPVETLTDILLNHVIIGVISSSDLNTLEAGYVSTLSTAGPNDTNISLYFNAGSEVVINGGADNGGATVDTADILANNGIIHVVDNVITLPTIVNFALADPDLSVLVSALTREDQPDFVGTLSGTTNSPFTVFAPNNQAFLDLLEELDVTALGDIDTATLEATLNYHVVAQSNVLSTGLSDNFTVPTLGGDITANTTGGPTLTDANGRISNIIISALDIQATNGVIHQIDKVILPPLSEE